MFRRLMGAVLLATGSLVFAAEPVREVKAEDPVAVRNDVAQPGEAIVTLRYFKIRKGSFPEFLQASQEGVWPFFEKIGSRVIGMWQVLHPDGIETAARDNPGYDEVWLMTRYASVEHWRATRDMAKLGGNGPDYQKARAALSLRQSLTLESNVQFLQGSTWQSPPQFLPGVE